jgi:hypothetical protein
LAAALTVTPLGKLMGTLAVALAAVNVFGGSGDLAHAGNVQEEGAQGTDGEALR